MPDYGIIENGELIISSEPKEGYKPIQYVQIPDIFDQLTQYVTQSIAVDNGNEIVFGVEIKELPPDGQQSNVF